MIKFDLLQIVYYDCNFWWISIGFVEKLDVWEGALFHLEYDMGVWKWDLFWLRNFILKLRKD